MDHNKLPLCCHWVCFDFCNMGLAVTLLFLFPISPLILHFLIRSQTKTRQKTVPHSPFPLACSARLSCLRWQDVCRWLLVTIKNVTVFPLWQMDLRLLVLNKCRFTIHNFTGFVLYITGLNILSQNLSAWHFQLIRGPCQFGFFFSFFFLSNRECRDW